MGGEARGARVRVRRCVGLRVASRALFVVWAVSWDVDVVGGRRNGDIAVEGALELEVRRGGTDLGWVLVRGFD